MLLNRWIVHTALKTITQMEPIERHHKARVANSRHHFMTKTSTLFSSLARGNCSPTALCVLHLVQSSNSTKAHYWWLIRSALTASVTLHAGGTVNHLWAAFQLAMCCCLQQFCSMEHHIEKL